MKKILVIFFFAVFILALDKQNAMANPEINYDQNKHLLSIHAEMTSFKAVLQDIEIKTGIKINVHGKIADKYITLSTDELPIKSIGDLLDELKLNNTALLYDKKGNVSEIFIFPEGTAMSQVPQTRARRGRNR